MLAKRTQKLQSSPTMAIDAQAKAFKQQGIAVINLSVGEPNFQTPDNIKKAAMKAIKDGFTFYTAPEGMLELREAVAMKFANENQLTYDPTEIIIGSGSKQLSYSAFQVLCNPGDEVIVPIPNWSTFVEQAKLAEAKPVLLKLKSPFKLTAKDVEKKLTPKTKILLLNSPSNPTGAMIDPEELEKIADLVVKHNIFVISDEIYEKLIYTQRHVSIASLNEKIKQRTITINGVSKSYAMTGWRIGYAGGPKEIIKTMQSLQSQMIGSSSSIAQKAAIEALTGQQDSIEEMKQAFARRRELCLAHLLTMNQLSFIEPEGAFYLFVPLENVLGDEYPTATAWAEALLEEEKVAIVPGEAFLYPGYFRLSYAASDEDLEEAMKRIKRFIAR